MEISQFLLCVNKAAGDQERQYKSCIAILPVVKRCEPKWLTDQIHVAIINSLYEWEVQSHTVYKQVE